MGAATNIPISATTTDFVGAVNAAIAVAGNFDRVLNQQLATSFRALDRETRNYEAGLGRVARTLAQQATEAARAAAAAQAAAAQRIATIGNGFKSVGQSLSTYVTLPLLAMGAAAFNSYAQIDGMVRGLKAATGSAAEATKQFKEFYDLSKNPGLGLQQTVDAGLQLETLGYKAVTAKKYIAEIGNAIALGGKGKFEFGNVITQFTQMAGKAKVLGEDLKPIVGASPVIAKAIANIFGSANSEDISKKLQAAGKGPKDFIEMLVTELSKVERVEAGPKNAIENIGDAFAIASYTVAGAADKILNATGAINGIGDLVGSAAEGFASLSTFGQGSILTLVGLAAAAGPLSIAIGTVIKLLPTLKLGFAALTGPIGLAVAAVALAAVLIIANWDKVSAYLKDSGIWDTVVRIVTAATDTIKAVWNAAGKLIMAVWDSIRGYIIPVAEFIGSTVANVFRTASGVIIGIFKTLTGILTLDWGKMREGLQNITAALWNGVVSAFSAGTTAVGTLFANWLDSIGAKDTANAVAAKVKAIAKSIDSVKIALLEAQKVGKDGIGLAEVTVAAKRTVTPSKSSFLGNAPGAAGKTYKKEDIGDLAIFKRQADLLKREIEELGADSPQLAAKQKELERIRIVIDDLLALSSKNQKTTISGISEITDPKAAATVRAIADNFHDIARTTPGIFAKDEVSGFFAIAKTGAKDFLNAFTLAKPSLEFYSNKLEEAKATIATMGLNGLKVPASLLNTVTALTAKLKSAQDATELAAIAANPANKDQGSGFNNVFSSAGVSSGAVEKMQGQISGATDAVNLSVAGLAAAMETGRASLRDAGAGLLAGLGESIGKGESPLKSALGAILSILGDYIIKLGTALLFSSALLLAQAPLTFGITLAPGLAQQVAGGALIVGGGVIKGLATKKFAKGGVFDRPSAGIFGEYAGATMNREIATPERLMANVFRGELENFGGRQSGNGNGAPVKIHLTGEFNASGKTMKTVIDRHINSLESYG